MRYDLPPGLSPDEERALLAALERYFSKKDSRPSPWSLAGRVEAAGQGALQARRLLASAWRALGVHPFARRGSPGLAGRGDAT